MVSRENKILVKEIDLGLSPYVNALKKQEKYFNHVIDQKIKNRKLTKKRNTNNFFLWVEHTPVITIGNRGNRNNLLVNEVELKDKKIQLFNTNRGGDITLHNPGQLVGYPIFDLENFFTDISKYLRLIEESVIKLLNHYGVNGERSTGETGVWIDAKKPSARKICAIGIKASRWVTMHGFAFNICNDLDYYDYIIPCGIKNKNITSLSKELNKNISVEEVKIKLKETFAEVFRISWI